MGNGDVLKPVDREQPGGPHEGWRVRANMATGPLQVARGGSLSFTDGQIVFRNNLADRLLTGRTQFVVALDEIQCISIVRPKVPIYNLVNGGFARTRLRITANNGELRLFVLRDPWAIAQRLRVMSGAPACAPERRYTKRETCISVIGFLILCGSLYFIFVAGGPQGWIQSLIGLALFLPVLALIAYAQPER